VLQRLFDSYGVQKKKPPGGAYKQWLQNILEKDLGSKFLSDLLGMGEDVYSIATDTVENMEKSERLRSQINTYASEYRELDSDVAHLMDDYNGIKASVDQLEGDIARMKRPRHDI
jgi:archaellum component FlaC